MGLISGEAKVGVEVVKKDTSIMNITEHMVFDKAELRNMIHVVDSN